MGTTTGKIPLKQFLALPPALLLQQLPQLSWSLAGKPPALVSAIPESPISLPHKLQECIVRMSLQTLLDFFMWIFKVVHASKCLTFCGCTSGQQAPGFYPWGVCRPCVLAPYHRRLGNFEAMFLQAFPEWCHKLASYRQFIIRLDKQFLWPTFLWPSSLAYYIYIAS